MGTGSGPSQFEKSDPNPDKNRPDPQHWFTVKTWQTDSEANNIFLKFAEAHPTESGDYIDYFLPVNKHQTLQDRLAAAGQLLVSHGIRLIGKGSES
jgi:hypothetical protein